MDSRTPKHLARSKWQSSGLTDHHARRSGFRALSAAQVKALSSRFHGAAALLIPYFTLAGKRTQFYRIRYLEKLPGAAGVVENPQRYDQLPVLQEAYYPPLFDWQKIAEDPKINIAITEGELKAACACANKIPMMALGGVYSFMSGKRGIELLPSMKEFVWKDRMVYITYDNDVAHKPQVMRAQRLLSQRLLSEGARIKYVSIPPGPAKGVDDYIVKHGAKAFVNLIDKALPFTESQALWGLNEEVVLIKKIDVVVERTTDLLMYPDQFMRHTYANRHYMQQIEKGSGKNAHVVLEETRLAPRWVEWEHRAELWDLSYDPGQPKVVNDKTWNLWPGWGVTPKRGDVRPWMWLLDFLFANDQKARKYFEQWCAYPIQHPGAKLYVAAVLWSRIKRVGKSAAAQALVKIYGKNAVVIDAKQLKSNFNSWAPNRQLVVGEEITTGETRIDADYLKNLITAPMFRVNEKNKPEYDIENHTNFLFLSNHPDAVFLEDGDKRYLIHGITQGSPAVRAKYEVYDAWLHGDGPSHLMAYFLDLNLRGFNPREHAPETMSKYEMIVAGKTDTGLWVMRLQEDPKTALKGLGLAASEGCDLFTPEQLYRAFDPDGRGRGRASIASLGRHLASAGFRQINGGIPVGTATGIHRLYAVRNVVRWEQATRREVKDHYDQFFSPKTAGGVK